VYSILKDNIYMYMCSYHSCLQRTSPSRPCYQKGGRHFTITSAYDSAS